MSFASMFRAFTIAAVVSFGSAHAGLVGDSVRLQFVGSNTSPLNTATVGAGEEGNFFGNQFYDFSDLGFSIRSNSIFGGIFGTSGEPISLILSDLDFGGALTNVTLSTSLSGVTVAFDAHTVTFSWAEQEIPRSTYLSANFIVGNSVGQVPEPGSVALLGLGLAALAVSRKRKRKQA